MSTNLESPKQFFGINSALLEKGLIFGVMAVAIFVLYGWVADGKKDEALRAKKFEDRMDKLEAKYDACQQYRMSEAYRIIERVDRRMDDWDKKMSRE